MLASAVRSGAGSRDFFGTAYGEAGGKFDGFQFGDGDVSVDDTLLLIEPEAAKQYDRRPEEDRRRGPAGADADGRPPAAAAGRPTIDGREKPGKAGPRPPAKARSFQGTADVPAATAKMRLVQIADEIVSLLASDPNATIRVTVEIAADFPSGVSDTIRRGVSENATSLGFKTKDWE